MTSRLHPLLDATRRLSHQVDGLRFSDPVAWVYNPLDYAWNVHAEYLERYGVGRDRPRTVLIGMNPGPFGMTQTGVPFGAVGMVRDWLGLSERDGRPLLPAPPQTQHPKRPIEGFACTREEVSGARLWGWARDEFGTPDAFFERFFIANYCPLVFLHETGRNITPDKLVKAEREPLLAACDQGLDDVIRALEGDNGGVARIVGVGTFAEKAAQRVVGDRHEVRRILHPSPASPAANRGWARAARSQLQDMGALG